MIRHKVKWKQSSNIEVSDIKRTTLIIGNNPMMTKLFLITLVNILLFIITMVDAGNHGNDETYDIGNNFTNKITSDVPAVRCDSARIRCALRRGCSSALQGYMLDCADLMAGRMNNCDDFCEASLIALTSTEEGESLMNCVCNDDFCSRSKARIEVCREGVLRANGKDAVVSCSVAHLICTADTSCSTALSYYDKLCKRMFNGRECTFRCNNSISILERQEKASKLQSCVCDGTESFDCFGIKKNMVKLCYPPPPSEAEVQLEEEETNEIDHGTDEDRKKAVKNSAPPRSVLGIKPMALMWHGIISVPSASAMVGLVSSIVVRWIWL